MSLWERQDTGVGIGGDVGGDWQVGEAYCRTYVHTDRYPPDAARVTIYLYAANLRGDKGCPPRYGIVRQTELMVCSNASDPDTETWCDYTYEHLDDPTGAGLWRGSMHNLDGVVEYTSAEEAEQMARALAARHTADDIDWDGRPPWS